MVQKGSRKMQAKQIKVSEMPNRFRMDTMSKRSRGFALAKISQLYIVFGEAKKSSNPYAYLDEKHVQGQICKYFGTPKGNIVRVSTQGGYIVKVNMDNFIDVYGVELVEE